MDAPVGRRDGRIAELLEGYLADVREGREPDREEFLRAHPEVAGELRAALVGLDFIDGPDDLPPEPEAARDAAPCVGTLGDFRLIREIGRGGMGVVYEAEQVSLDRKVALKVLPFAAVLDERQRRRFHHEAQAAALLHHTNIVPVYSVGMERGVHYYAMQYIEGRSLSEVLVELRANDAGPDRGRTARKSRTKEAARPPSSAEARALTPQGTTRSPDYCRAIARLGVQAAEALDHAHQNGVVHRDIKPANLMLDPRGQVWIADFGLAQSRTSGNLTMTGAIVGTLRYMSPEQALPRRTPLDHRTDIYSLGATLYEALTLRPAFPGDDAPEVIQDIAYRQPDRPGGLNGAVPAGLETVVLKALAKDPDDRYATAQEMADDLRRFLDDKPVVARRPSILDRAGLWARRHRVAVASTATVLIVALATSTVLIAGEKRSTEEAKQQVEKSLEQSRKSAARAEAALEESRNSAAIAERNFEKALLAVDTMLTRVGADELAGVPGLETVRARVLQDALDFFQGFLDAHKDDPRVRLQTAKAHMRVGVLHYNLGRHEAALASLTRSREILVDLAPPDGPWDLVHDTLVHVEVRRAGTLQGSRPEEALDILRRAVALAERGSIARPDLPHMENCLAQTEREVGGVLLTLGRLADADATYASAATRQEALLARTPGDRTLQDGLAQSLESRCSLALFMERPEEAVRFGRRALELGRSAETGATGSPPAGASANLQRLLGEAYLDVGDLVEAERALRIAFETMEKAATDFPHFPTASLDAGETAAALGAALQQLGRTDESEAMRGRAMARFETFLDRHRGAAELRARGARKALNAGCFLSAAGDEARAAVAFRTAIALRRDLLEASPDLPQCMHDLAYAINALCDDARGRLKEGEGESLLQEVIRLEERAIAVSGKAPVFERTLAQAFHDLAHVRSDAGDEKGAERALRRAVEVLRAPATGSGSGVADRNDLGDTLSCLGDTLCRLGRLDEAAEAVDESIALLEGTTRSEGRAHSPIDDLAKALMTRADVEKARGAKDEEEKWIRRAIGKREEVVARTRVPPGFRSELMHDTYRLAILLKDNGGTPDEQERLYLRAMEVGHGLMEGGHREFRTLDCVAHASQSLAMQRFKGGRAEEAEPGYRECIRLHEAMVALPDAGPGVKSCLAECRGNLAVFLDGTSRAPEAEKEYRAAIELLAGLAAEAPKPAIRERVLYCYGSLGMNLMTQGRMEDAVREIRGVAEQARLWADEDPVGCKSILAKSLHNLCFVYQRAGNRRELMATYERMVECNPGSFHSYNNFVLDLSDGPEASLRDPRRAIALAKRAVEESDDPANAWLLLGQALVCDGQWKEALPAYAKARELGYGMDGSDWIYEALAHARLGNRSEAQDLYDRTVAWLEGSERAGEERLVRRRDEVGKLLRTAAK